MEKSSWLRQSPHLHSTPSVFTQQSTVCKCSYWSCGSVRVWALRSSSTSAVTGMTSTKLSAPALIVLSWVLSRCWLTRCRYCRYCTHWHVSDCCHTVSVTCGVQAGWSIIAWGKRGGGYLLGFSDTTDCCWLLTVDDHFIWDAADSGPPHSWWYFIPHSPQKPSGSNGLNTIILTTHAAITFIFHSPHQVKLILKQS